MKSDRMVIGAVLFLSGGLGLLFGFTDGTTGFNIGYPFSTTKLHVDITTTGIPVLAGLPMLAAGALLLLFALIAAIAAQFQRSEPFQTLHLPSNMPSKRQGPFEE
jgi:hypothetical protein